MPSGPIGNLQANELLSSDGSTVTSVTAADSVLTALAANTARQGGVLFNDADKACYVKFGASASTTSFTAKLAPKDADGIGGYLNLGALRVYRGAITAIWDASPTGALRITELS
jgi:hypothetical protein